AIRSRTSGRRSLRSAAIRLPAPNSHGSSAVISATWDSLPQISHWGILTWESFPRIWQMLVGNNPTASGQWGPGVHEETHMTVWQRPVLTIGAMAASATLTTASWVLGQGGGVVTMQVLKGGVPFAVFGGARPAGELLEALVFPCPADCRGAAQHCIET